jgi:parallel beta-helix repeat protein
MHENSTASARKRPIRVLAVFAVAFLLQGASLAIFSDDRPEPEAENFEGTHSVAGAPLIPNVFTVTSEASSGPGSLLEAVTMANNQPGLDLIRFAFTGPVTIPVTTTLVITDPVDIEGHSSLTGTTPVSLTVDAVNLNDDLFYIHGTSGASLRRMRLINAAQGYGIYITGTTNTEVISNTIENSLGGIHLENTSHITVTHNVFSDIVFWPLGSWFGESLLMQGNALFNTGFIGFNMTNGTQNAFIISNTIDVVTDPGGFGISVEGFPAPTGIVMRGNRYTDTTPIFLSPTANGGFPAPEIDFVALSITGTLSFGAKSPADPTVFTYPLSLDVYRVRGSAYQPLGEVFFYSDTDYPDPVSYTIPVPPGEVLLTDQLALLATTANPNTSEFSAPINVGSDLPVELTGIEAVVQGDEVVLMWSTASETNNAGFEIQHRADAGERSTWQRVGFVAGQGNSDEVTGYEFGIEDLEPGRHLFRLKQVDFGGAFEFSPEVEAIVEVPGSHLLGDAYPNPFNPTAYFSVAVPTRQSVRVDLFDASGRFVRALFEGELKANEQQRILIDGATLASGVYLYRVTGDSFSETKMVTLQK